MSSRVKYFFSCAVARRVPIRRNKVRNRDLVFIFQMDLMMGKGKDL
jgi:hypothetical protein